MTTAIITPNENQMCGMFQLAKDLAVEFNGKVLTKDTIYPFWTKDFKQVITLLYPVHQYGKIGKSRGLKWICYDQEVPEPNKLHFPNFFRRQYMKWFSWVNQRSKKGADDYWELSQRKQKPRWTIPKIFTDKQKEKFATGFADYAIYIGRTTDYKNYDWLEKIMKELYIPLIHPIDADDNLLCYLLSNAKLFVTASIWEGYGRSVMEAQALGITTVCFDTGVHKRLVKKGFVIPNGNFKMFKDKVKEVWD